MTQKSHNNFDLSIRFTPDGFYLLVSDNGQQISSKKLHTDFNKLTETEIIDLLAGQPELQMIFKSVRLIFQTSNYTFVPAEFFNSTELTTFLKLQHPNLNKSDALLFNKLEPWAAVNIFAVPAQLNKVLHNFLPETNIEHHLSILLTDDIDMQNGKIIHILTRNAEADFIVLNDNKLILANTFETNTPEDVAYHAVNTVSQLGFSSDECKVIVHGNEKPNDIEVLLSNYFSNCVASILSF